MVQYIHSSLYGLTYHARATFMPSFRSKHTLEGVHAVAVDDDVETSSYHIKDALDANFTYNSHSHSNRQPPSTRQHGLRAGVNNQTAMNRGQLESGNRLGRQPYQPGTGQGTHYIDTHWTPSGHGTRCPDPWEGCFTATPAESQVQLGMLEQWGQSDLLEVTTARPRCGTRTPNPRIGSPRS